MVILQIIPSLSSGGAERFVVNLCNSICQSGDEVHIAIMFYDSEKYLFNKVFLDERIKLHFIDAKRGNFNILFAFYRLVKKIKPNYIHCHLAVLQYLALVYILFPKIRIIHTLHSLTKYASGDSKWKTILYRTLYKIEKVKPVTISDECHNSYAEFYNLNNDSLIENGCPAVKPTSNFSSVKKQVEMMKKTQDTKVFIHVGRFHEAKNQQMLIDSFNKLFDRGLDFILLIVGAGFDQPEAESLVKKANEKVFFLGERTNVSDFLMVSNAFCMTSIYEGLPISLIEAMSCGLIPICTAVGGIRNVISEGINGFLAQSNNVDSYVEAVDRYLSKNIRRDTIINDFEANYSIELCKNKYIELLKN